MRLTLTTIFLLVATNYFPTTICFSQQDASSQKPVRLLLVDGSEFIGNILEEDSISISFKTISNISMMIPKGQVKTIEILQGRLTDREYVRPDPNYTRLFFGPTARPLKSGQGYFSTYEIFFPFFAVGITDFLTVGGGMSLLPGAENQLVYLAPKITPIQMENFNVAGGLLYINSTAVSSEGVGFYYGVGTYGSQTASLTFGFGWGFYGSDIAHNPIVMIGGEFRASNSIKIISENWIPLNSDITYISFGIRFFGENLAADLGLFHPAGLRMTGFPFFPWVGFAYNFGLTK